jgi:hypothetical protein
MGQRRDRGSGSALALCGVVVVALAIVIVAKVVVAAAQQAAAQHAADAAALAGVSGGIGAAREVAAANEAELVGFSTGVGRAGGSLRVTVSVRRGDRIAEATAEGDRRPRSVKPADQAWHPVGGLRALRSTQCPMATSVRRPPPPRPPTRTPRPPM